MNEISEQKNQLSYGHDIGIQFVCKVLLTWLTFEGIQFTVKILNIGTCMSEQTV